jgi:hypothetical protein
MATYELVRNAFVEVEHVTDTHKKDCAKIIVNDSYEHIFPHTSRVSKHLDVMTPSDLQKRLNNGTFFFVDNHLVDWRDGIYNGFIHEDNTIDEYMDLLGFQYTENIPFTHRKKSTSPILLRSVWNKGEIMVPGYAEVGTDFTSELSFIWNPFVTTINSSFDLVRLICTNGMIGVTSFLNSKVPLFNREMQHLDIAATQIQNKINDIVIGRISNMITERASVGHCLLLEKHTIERIGSVDDLTEHARLLNLLNAISPSNNLSDVYRDSVFEDKHVAAQLPAHLTLFDVYNVATELRTHTSESRTSTDFSLDKFANGILFDEDTKNYRVHGANTALASFSNPDNAFFGIMAA